MMGENRYNCEEKRAQLLRREIIIKRKKEFFLGINPNKNNMAIDIHKVASYHLAQPDLYFIFKFV